MIDYVLHRGDSLTRTVQIIPYEVRGDFKEFAQRSDGEWVHLNETTQPAHDLGFKVLRDSLPALLAVLAKELGAVEHPAQLRKDYEAERTRVDKFIEHALRGGA